MTHENKQQGVFLFFFATPHPPSLVLWEQLVSGIMMLQRNFFKYLILFCSIVVWFGKVCTALKFTNGTFYLACSETLV